ncbi:extended synaptotagmin-2-like isoform X3 [Littorina saxatilis]|uniref:Extended synaptotagmin-2 n=1 Tax=Littorina saxatilis TaxID=31220 RepID=A0AAN9ASZ2_9CAEN
MATPKPETPTTSKSKESPSHSQQRKAVVEDTLLLNVVQAYFKKAAVVLAVWATGYFRFSPSWLLLGLVVYVWKERHNAAKKNTIAIAQAIARDEKGVILAKVEDLPSWVYFPDVERAEWVNKMIDQLWPYIGDYVRKLLQESIEPQIRASLPSSIGSFRFSKIELGDIPPRIGGVKVYTSQVRRDEIYMDLEINYASDCNISVQVKGMNFGIKNFILRGTMRVIFRPLINKTPLIGGMSVFFLNNPEVDFDLTSLANAFDLPGLSDMLHSIVQEQIAAIMVLPNRIPIQMASNVDVRKLKYPQPQGVLRVHVIEARDLKKADIGLTGKGKSDPYTIVTVGAQSFQTRVIDNTVSPVWDEAFEFVIDERDGQFLNLVLRDKDPGNKDDELGSISVEISSIFEKGTLDEWLTLDDVKKGMVHIRAVWLYLANDPLELDRVRDLAIDEDSIHSALLIVNLDSALDLPMIEKNQFVVKYCGVPALFFELCLRNSKRGKKTLAEPSPSAVLTLGQTTHESAVRAATTEPRWEENFRFFVANPSLQTLEMEIRDTKTKKTIGVGAVRLKELMNAEQMILDQKFHIKSDEPNSCMYMTLVLRVLTPESNPEWLESEHLYKDDSPEEGSSVDTPTKAGTDKAGTSVDTVPTAGHPDSTDKTAGSDIKSETIKSVSSSPASETEVRQRRTGPPPSAPGSSVSVGEAGRFGVGRIQLTFRYSLQRQCLVVVIHKIVDLKPAEGDSKGLADPYIKMYLLPDRDSKSKRKTDVVKDNLNPVFDQTFEYGVSTAELANRTLELTVKNETGMFSSSQSVLGMAMVDLSTLDTSKATTQWFDLAPENSAKATSLESDV